LKLLKKHKLSEFWILTGHKGKGKSSTARGLLNFLSHHGYSYTTLESENNSADILFLDDIARFFYKREFMTKQNREFMKFIRLVRGVYLLILATVQRWHDVDVDIRKDSDVIICHVVGPGIFIHPIIGVVVCNPNFDEDMSFRFKQLEKAKEALKASLGVI